MVTVQSFCWITDECVCMRINILILSFILSDYIWDVTVTWNMKDLATHIPVYMTITVSRFPIDCLQVCLDLSPSGGLRIYEGPGLKCKTGTTGMWGGNFCCSFWNMAPTPSAVHKCSQPLFCIFMKENKVFTCPGSICRFLVSRIRPTH